MVQGMIIVTIHGTCVNSWFRSSGTLSDPSCAAIPIISSPDDGYQDIPALERQMGFVKTF